MRIKKGVILAGIQVQINPVLIEAEKLWEENGEELWITEGLGGKHSNMSLHYSGYALDLRSRYFPKEKHQVIADELQKRLGDEFDVVVHSTHIHAEWDQGKYLLGRK